MLFYGRISQADQSISPSYQNEVPCIWEKATDHIHLASVRLFNFFPEPPQTIQ